MQVKKRFESSANQVYILRENLLAHRKFWHMMIKGVSYFLITILILNSSFFESSKLYIYHHLNILQSLSVFYYWSSEYFELKKIHKSGGLPLLVNETSLYFFKPKHIQKTIGVREYKKRLIFIIYNCLAKIINGRIYREISLNVCL